MEKAEKTVRLVPEGSIVILNKNDNEIGDALVRLELSSPTEGLSIIEPISREEDFWISGVYKVVFFQEDSNRTQDALEYCELYHTPLITVVKQSWNKSANFPIIHLAPWELDTLHNIAKSKMEMMGRGVNTSFTINSSLTHNSIVRYGMTGCARGLLILRDLIIKERVAGRMRSGYYYFDDILQAFNRH